MTLANVESHVIVTKMVVGSQITGTLEYYVDRYGILDRTVY